MTWGIRAHDAAKFLFPIINAGDRSGETREIRNIADISTLSLQGDLKTPPESDWDGRRWYAEDQLGGPGRKRRRAHKRNVRKALREFTELDDTDAVEIVAKGGRLCDACALKRHCNAEYHGSNHQPTRETARINTLAETITERDLGPATVTYENQTYISLHGKERTHRVARLTTTAGTLRRMWLHK